MEVTEIRRKKLAQLAGNYKSRSEFAKKLNIEANYLYQLQKGIRNISEKTARNIENKLNLSHLWLDFDDLIEEPKAAYNHNSKSILVNSKQELELLHYFGLLTHEQKENALSTIKDTVKTNKDLFAKLQLIYGDKK